MRPRPARAECPVPSGSSSASAVIENDGDGRAGAAETGQCAARGAALDELHFKRFILNARKKIDRMEEKTD